MKAHKLKWLYIALILLCLLPIRTVVARNLNIENKGSLTIHKYLNPNIIPIDQGGDGYQGDGLFQSEDNQIPLGMTQPLSGVEFSVYGRLSKQDIHFLLGTNDDTELSKNQEITDIPLDLSHVDQYIKDHDPLFKGVTNDDGEVIFENIPIQSDDLSDNLYLVVETKLPGLSSLGESIVQLKSAPVLVNVPVSNPKQDSVEEEVDQYIYNVHLYMKNYAQKEPGIEKDIDKPSHGAGEAIKYALTITPLDKDISEFKELEVTDALDASLNFLQLGHTGGTSPIDSDTDIAKPVAPQESVQFYNGTKDETVILVPDVDYNVTTPESGKNGVLRWEFTDQGLQKLTGIEEGDNSFIRLFFMAETNNNVILNQVIPNNAQVDFVNKWGYGSNGDINPPKPSNVVNTIFGDPKFIKSDQDDPSLHLFGAKFLVRNRSTQAITAYNHLEGEPNRQLITYPAGTMLYAVIKNSEVVGWTPDWQEAIKQDWVLTSNDEGVFHVTGLPYTHEVYYRKMYIFGVQKEKVINGTTVPYVDRYEYVLADARTKDTSKEEINKEVDNIIKDKSTDDEKWFFYKESEADPEKFKLSTSEIIDYLGDTKNYYELIEIKAPEGYTLLEKQRTLDRKSNQRIDFGSLGKDNLFIPNSALKDDFLMPLAFTVPGGTEDWGQVEESMFQGNQTGLDTIIPNKKLPVMPITGVTGMFILLVIGILILILAFLWRKKNKEKIKSYYS